jgi:CubicO group peptidase (beta-lactamase class C family)
MPDAGGDWDVAHLTDVGMDVGTMEDMINDHPLKGNGVQGVLIVRNGKLVYEEYEEGRNSFNTFFEFDKETVHELMSVTKSVTALLVGIAYEQGHIASLQDPLSAYLSHSGHTDLPLDSLLTMRAGLQWDEWSVPYSNNRNSHTAMNNSGRPIDYVLNRPVVAQPNERFVYNSGLTMVMGEVVRQATGFRGDFYAREHLFNPLGIDEYTWYVYPDGTLHTGGGLSLLPRDMAKLGQLVLNGGVWEGQQIISEDYLQLAISEIHRLPSSVTLGDGYGYFWWRNIFQVGSRQVRAIHASGYGGQYIYIVPEFDLVTVWTGGNYTSGNPFVSDAYMEDYVLPAILNANN